VAWIFASRASFGEGAGRFCQCLLGAVLTRLAVLPRWTLRGGKKLFRGEGFGSEDPTVRSQRVGHRQVKPIPPFAKTAKSGAPAKSKTQLRNGIASAGSASVVMRKMQERRVGHPPVGVFGHGPANSCGICDMPCPTEETKNDAELCAENSRACYVVALAQARMPVVLEGKEPAGGQRYE
jgi:hypothetical protein